MSDCAMWCTSCGVRLAQEEIQGWGCPKCGNQGIPCSPTKDVTVEVNWHELHILCCWAERWSEILAKDDAGNASVVYAIARRLQQQWPDLGRLTLAGEISSLPEDLADTGIAIAGVESTIPNIRPSVEIGPGAVGFARTRNGGDHGLSTPPTDAPDLAAVRAEVEQLKALMKEGIAAVNAAYEMACAEHQMHNARARKFDAIVTAFKVKASAALGQSARAGGHG